MIGNLLTWNPCCTLFFGVVGFEFTISVFVEFDSVTGDSKFYLVRFRNVFDLREKGIFLIYRVVLWKAHSHAKVIRATPTVTSKLYVLECVEVGARQK